MRHVETYCDGPSSRVFTSPDGGPLRPRNWRARFFDPAVAAAGLGPYIDEDDEEQREHRGVRPYDLRHTAATLMLANHASIRQVADRLGHSSPSVTLNVYAHTLPQVEQRLNDALDDTFRSAAPSVPPAAASGSGSNVRRMSTKRR